MSEAYNVHRDLVALWIRQAVYFDGNFKVANSGRSYLVVNKGKTTFSDNGHLKKYNRKPEVLEKILHGLVNKYQSFEHNGYYYYYSRGEWRRHKR